MDIVRNAPKGLKRKALVTAVVVAALLGIAVTAWRSTASAAPSIDRASVWTEQVHRGDLLRQVPVQGTLVPEHVQWLSAVSAARVAKIVVRPGAEVDPDTVIMVLENADLDLAALEADQQAASAESTLIQLDVKTHADEKLQESTLIGLRADLRDADRHADTADRLASESLMSDADHRDAQNHAKGLGDRVQAEAARLQVLHTGCDRQLAAQRAEVEHLREIAAFRRKQLAALEVRAGVHGIVQDVPLENGQWVAIGTVLAKVAEPDHLKADVKVAEGDAKDVHKGLPVRFEAPSGNFRGHVARIDPNVISGTVRLEVELDDALPAGARADQAVSGYVEIEKLEGVLFVARPAGAQDASTAGVFRLDPDHTYASRVTARLGRGSPRDVEILGGLAEGDEIVVSDTSTWETTDKIRLK